MSTFDEERFVGLAAIGLAHEFWRGQEGTVEAAHIDRRISDGEMFAANVVATRICLEQLRRWQLGHFDPKAVAAQYPEAVAAQLSGELRVAHWEGGHLSYRDAADLLGPYYDAWRSAIADEARQLSDRIVEQGLLEVLAKYADFASLAAPHWWGGPGWPAMVDAFVDAMEGLPPGLPDGLRNRQTVRRLLLDAPGVLGTEALQWCVEQGIRNAA
jgi:hypothetical protein